MQSKNLLEERIKKIDNNLLILQERINWLQQKINKTQVEFWKLKAQKRELQKQLSDEKYEPEEPGEWGARRAKILNIVRAKTLNDYRGNCE